MRNYNKKGYIMGKGSSARPIRDKENFEYNWDKIFSKKKRSDDVSPHLQEYELNKSTGELQKVDNGD